jgi:hypothetical protein
VDHCRWTEYPYFFTIRSIRAARTLDGRPALSVIAQTWDVPPRRLHVHTCGYCKSRYVLGGDLLYAWVSVKDSSKSACFAFRRSTKQLAPAAPESIVTFGGMVPAGIEMVCAHREARRDSRMLPRPWREITPIRAYS